MKMNTDKMIPIDLSINITPLIVGDVIYNNFVKHEWAIDKDEVDDFNEVGDSFNTYFVVSFADRPNTGENPVGDDVVVDAWHECERYTDRAGDLTWIIDDGLPLAKWKPNHEAMLKQWEAEQAKDVHIDNDDDLAVDSEKVGVSPRVLEVCHGEEWHECIRLGLDIFGNYAYQISGGEFKGEFNATPTEHDFRAIKTDEEKLFDALYLATVDDDISDDLNRELVIELMNHKDFTITLKV